MIDLAGGNRRLTLRNRGGKSSQASSSVLPMLVATVVLSLFVFNCAIGCASAPFVSVVNGVPTPGAANIREMPDPSSRKVAAMLNGEKLFVVLCVSVTRSATEPASVWCKVRVNQRTGWAYRKYFEPQSNGLFKVTGISDDDGVSVRRSAEIDSNLAFVLPLSSRDIQIGACLQIADGEVCEIVAPSLEGWINARFLSSRPKTDSAPSDSPNSAAGEQGGQPTNGSELPTNSVQDLQTPSKDAPITTEPVVAWWQITIQDLLHQRQGRLVLVILSAFAALLIVNLIIRQLRRAVGSNVGFGWLGQVLGFGFVVSVLSLLVFGQEMQSLVAEYINKYAVQGIEDAPLSEQDIASLKVDKNWGLGAWPRLDSEDHRLFYLDEMAAGQKRLIWPNNYRAGIFERRTGESVAVFLWPQNCTYSGCLLDFFESDRYLRPIQGKVSKIASIRAFNIKKTLSFRNGMPIFVDIEGRVYWWDGSKFVVQTTHVDDEDAKARLSKFNWSPQYCQQVWKDDDFLSGADGKSKPIRGVIYKVLTFDVLLLELPICLLPPEVKLTEVLSESEAKRLWNESVGTLVDRLQLDIPAELLPISADREVGRSLDEHLELLYGDEVDVTCMEREFRVTGTFAAPVNCKVEKLRRVQGYMYDPAFD